MQIEACGLPQTILKNKTVLLTGGGGGIGFEAARALCWLGARVIIAECDMEKGRTAQNILQSEFDENAAEFYQIDISDDAQVKALCEYALDKYGFVDVVFNNATITPMGAVDAVTLEDWDKSYAVNLRAPLALTQILLPEMKKRDSGVIVFVPSSGAAPYMGAYEVFKTAQVELCNTLAGELEDMGICTYSIGPGLVKTETAAKAIEIVAARMGISIDAFYEMNAKHIIGVEEAGVGFALSVVFADKYNGSEVSSIQALMDAGLYDDVDVKEEAKGGINGAAISPLVLETVRIFREQMDGWKSRNVFERQWVLRDFKKTVGESAEQFETKINQIEAAVSDGHHFGALPGFKKDFLRLHSYYQHQYDLLQGYEKNPQKLKEHSEIMEDWMSILQKIIEAV